MNESKYPGRKKLCSTAFEKNMKVKRYQHEPSITSSLRFVRSLSVLLSYPVAFHEPRFVRVPPTSGEGVHDLGRTVVFGRGHLLVVDYLQELREIDRATHIGVHNADQLKQLLWSMTKQKRKS
jgi:hypothetical protein